MREDEIIKSAVARLHAAGIFQMTMRAPSYFYFSLNTFLNSSFNTGTTSNKSPTIP